MLREYEQLSYGEIAAVLRMPVNTVRSRLFRARAALKNQLMPVKKGLGPRNFMERHAQHAFDAEEVMAYLDGELEARRAAELAAHLVSCSECQEVAQGFRALSERMLSFEVEHPSAGMNEKVLAALDSSNSAKAGEYQTALDHGAWNWRRMFARPRNWAIACVVAVVAMLGDRDTESRAERKPVASSAAEILRTL